MPESDDQQHAPGAGAKVVAQDLLTTQEAAAALNVSRSHVHEQVDNGTLRGEVLSKGVRQWIPAAEVERVREAMRSGMPTAIDEIMKMTEDASRRELEDAQVSAARRWTPTA